MQLRLGLFYVLFLGSDIELNWMEVMIMEKKRLFKVTKSLQKGYRVGCTGKMMVLPVSNFLEPYKELERLMKAYVDLKERSDSVDDVILNLVTQIDEKDQKVLETEKILEREREINKECRDLTTDLVSWKTLSWTEQMKGMKKGSGRTADAMIVANAVGGMSIQEIMAQKYPYKKDGVKKYTRTKIYAALTVKTDEDVRRIRELYDDFPEVFDGIEWSEVEAWMRKKHNKTLNMGGGKN